jgi:FkbM family methyltransferase
LKPLAAIGAAINEARYVWRHPARDFRSLPRFVEWQCRCALKLPAIVAFASYDVVLYCPAERRGPGKLHFIFRERYEPELAALRQFVREGDSVIDIGAHHGAYTVTLARLVGPTGHVLAFEPASHSAATLRRNVILNKFKNVEVKEAALSNTSGSGRLQLHSDSSRNQLVPTMSSPKIARRTESVDILTLDEAAERGPVRYLKIDVEGAEGLVLAGAARILAQDHPIVQFEHNTTVPHAPKPISSAWELLTALDYTMFRVTLEGLNPLLAPPRAGANVVAMPPRTTSL